MNIHDLSTAEIIKELQVQRCLDDRAAAVLESELDRRCGTLFRDAGRGGFEPLFGDTAVG